MALIDMNDMLAHAYQHGYAVGVFTVGDMESLHAVMEAAEASRAPVVLTPEATDGSRLEMVLPAMEVAGHRARVPVAIQVAVPGDPEAAAHAIRLGANGLLIRCGGDGFPETVQQAQGVADTARACGLAAEAEPDPGTVTTPAEVRRFAEKAGIDGLRLAPGKPDDSSGKGRADPNRIKRIHKALEAPLSLDIEGGLSEDQYPRLIRHGVAAFRFGAPPSPTATEAERAMRVWGAAGRAAEVLAQCTPWDNAEQLLLCNLAEVPEAEVEEALARGERILRRMPGVREAVGIRATSPDAPYRCAWRVRLCHPSALSGFQDHPDRAAFANGNVHPAVEGCTGIQFRRPHAGDGPPADPPGPPGPRGPSAALGPAPEPGAWKRLA
ncbi:MAG: class II fructose-bisphosphate aldolase [Thiohalorhabdus sp.]|uniref:class II fructose-bisphosphate aldolase n=1 Tax=Thiohalorhabdus sp. TaxID=3094134 RepID=UPI0039807D20